MTAKQDIRSFANSPRIFIEDLGYSVEADPTRPGTWRWMAPSDSDSYFDTEMAAFDAAWDDAVAQTQSIRGITSAQWERMDADDRRIAITLALSDEMPRLDALSLNTQALWIAHARRSYPDADPSQTFRLAVNAFEEEEGTLPPMD